MGTYISITLTVSDTWKVIEALDARARDYQHGPWQWMREQAVEMDRLANHLRGLLREWGGLPREQ